MWTGAEPSAGGSTVEVTQTLTSGTGIASININGTSTTLYAPTPPTVPGASSTTPSMDGTAAIGTATTYARADHVHPTDTSRQATLVSGTNIKTVGGTSLLGSGDIPITITMEDTDVDAAVEAAWPVGSYEITNDIPSYLSIDKTTANEGETVTVEVTDRIMLDPMSGLGVTDSDTHETLLVLAPTGSGLIAVGTIYTFSMPATGVSVGYCE